LFKLYHKAQTLSVQHFATIFSLPLQVLSSVNIIKLFNFPQIDTCVRFITGRRLFTGIRDPHIEALRQKNGIMKVGFHGNGTFDADDVTALEALFPPLMIDSVAFDGSGNFELDISGLTSGTVYKLWRETDLTADPSFTNMVNSAPAGSGANTLSDPNPPTGQAFYKVSD